MPESFEQVSSTRVGKNTMPFAEKPKKIVAATNVQKANHRSSARIIKPITTVYTNPAIDRGKSVSIRESSSHKMYRNKNKLKQQLVSIPGYRSKQHISPAASAHSYNAFFNESTDSNYEMPQIAALDRIMKLRRSIVKVRKSDTKDTKKEELLTETVEISDDDFFDINFDSESETSTESRDDKMNEIKDSFRKSSHILEKYLPREKDFFEILGELPEIDDISSDRTEISEENILYRISTSHVQFDDAGKFVDPLTGEVLKSSSTSIIETAEKAEQEKSQISIHPEDSTIDLMAEIEEDEDLGKEVAQTDFEEYKSAEHDDDLVKLFSFPLRIMSTTEERVVPHLTEEYLRKVRTEIQDFVKNIINNVVDLSEYRNSDIVLRERLDKKKLVTELEEKLHKLKTEQKFNLFLNKGIVDMLQRKGEYRYLHQDEPERIMGLIDKNMELKDRLSDLLLQEEQLEYHIFKKVTDLKALEKQEERIAKESIENLRKTITKALYRESFSYLNEFVVHSLQEMASKRDEISSRRFLYIEKSHTLAVLKEQESKLDNIGENLTVRNFLHLQSKAAAMSKKIDERQQELKQVRHKRNQFVHKISHLREFSTAMQIKLDVKQRALDDLLEEKMLARNEVNNQKRIKQSIRSDIGAIQLQSGLAGNNALLLDFNETADRIAEMKATIDQLKQKHEQLEKRYKRLERRCSENTRISNI